MIKYGRAACDLTGIPELHAKVFQSVADLTGNVISSRAVGIYATGLILEGYASKGFHNKAKSCNWGPMAGFVLDDPRFTKVGGTEDGRREQANALKHAINDYNAIEVPLYISEDRRKWLAAQRLITFIDRDIDSYTYRGVSPWGLSLDFKLKRERPSGANEKMWAVLYKSADRCSVRAGAAVAEWTPVMAMRDPMCAIPADNYRAATTGDYDLFALWARRANYNPDILDRRMVSHTVLEDNIRNRVMNTGEDAHLGNMTLRLHQIRNLLNQGFQGAGYMGGNMVHHSDEGGRPFVRDIDLPIFAVVPGRSQCFAIETVPDLRQFITAELNGEFAPVFSPGWMKQLVFGSDINAANALHAELSRKLEIIRRRF
ncbi:anthrax toxin-like adenylyl cyclase domain-containing protein [Spirosoma fluviale]|uniref:Toxin LF subunit n=1 Tax=Spirosoma fluviale TaxID=1597977 RepID=A0A286G4W8_9BACT|nr:anthrax toxin-like adenylyl cyclase domain-containing protein [Spirosoma fluviale]SOD90024.1 toxin LF subunit [Spirosoma fluviale]